MTWFVLAAFLGAFLVFQVQPLMGKFLLPWFGGGPAVWTTCMLFFQTLLLAGYVYAHLLGRLLGRRGQAIVHGGALAVSLLALNLTPSAAWRPDPGDGPLGRILLLLLTHVGLPYLLLSSTGPLVQVWFHRAYPERSPYRLYALSNLGSLLALLSYPVILERLLPLSGQTWVWSALYLGFVVLAAGCAWKQLRVKEPGSEGPTGGGKELREREGGQAPRTVEILLWTALAASASTLMLATTNQLSLEISALPYVWVGPLALYLLSFILSFDHARWYSRSLFGGILAGSVAFLLLLPGIGWVPSLALHVSLYGVVLFSACMCCHGELARRKPRPSRLTWFYLSIASGGALGGVLAGVVAPMVFRGGYWEFPLGLGLCCASSAAAWIQDSFGGGQRRLVVLGVPTVAGLALLAAALIGGVRADLQVSLLAMRDFYGVLRVEREVDAAGAGLCLTNDAIAHGVQYAASSMRDRPTSYYGPHSGVGLALSARARANGGRGLRIGAVGLGVGTLAAYLEPADTLRFYEIDPAVVTLARQTFSYLRDSAGTIQIVVGDARIRLEEDLAAGSVRPFDLLVVDAFTAGTIPVHLLTAEAVAVYKHLLEPDGILLFHISNEHLDLMPVLRGIARETGYALGQVEDPGNESAGTFASQWAALARDGSRLRDLGFTLDPGPDGGRKEVSWTDQYASVWEITKW